MDAISRVPGVGLDILNRQSTQIQKAVKPEAEVSKEESSREPSAAQGPKEKSGKIEGTLDVEA